MASAVQKVSLSVVGLATAAVLVPQLTVDNSAAETVRQVAQAAEAERLAKGGSRHPSVGVVDHALWGDRTMGQRREMLRKLSNINAKWVRIGLPWALVQPNRPSSKGGGWSPWAFDRVDGVIRAAKRNNLNVSITFLGTPGWANGGLGSKYLPDNPDAYGRAIAHLAKRYRGDVQSWEIWNEASGDVHLKGATDREYKQLLCAAYPAVKRNAPGAKVVLAGTGGIQVDWIRKQYKLGAKRCFDVVSVHPYNSGLNPRTPSWNGGTPRWIVAAREVRQVMRRHNDARASVWFTEFGYSTVSKSLGGVTPRQQAKWIVEVIKMTDRRLPFVERMFIYMSRDEVSPDLVKDRHYGLYTLQLKPKRSALALDRYLTRVKQG